jgi:TonB family protein
MEKPRKKFLKLPGLDGGKELLRRFLKENMQYPKQALEQGIEGDVIIRFKVTGKGEIQDAVVMNGPGYGCEEEALRLVSMMRYTSVKNRGVRVTTNNKIRIPFRLPKRKKTSFRISYAPKSTQEIKPVKEEPKKETGTTYSYTIRLSH